MIQKHKFEFRFVNTILGLISVGTLALTISCTDTVPEQKSNDAGYQEIAGDEINLQWNVSGSQDLEVIVSAPTTGWIAIGFDPTSQMKDANFVLCAVISGTATARDDFGVGSYTHSPDTVLGGADNVTVLGGSENAERTEVQFTIPLDSGDEYDRVLIPGNEYTVLLAHGGSDDFGMKHTYRTSVQITL